MNNAQKLNIEEFDALVDEYGGELDGWPAAQRASAEELVAADNEAQKILARARRFHELLDQDATIAASSELRARILASAPGGEMAAVRTDGGLRGLWPFGPIWRPVTALACAALLGIYVGIADPGMLFGEQSAQANVPSDMIVLAERSGLGLEEVE